MFSFGTETETFLKKKKRFAPQAENFFQNNLLVLKSGALLIPGIHQFWPYLKSKTDLLVEEQV